MPKASLLGLTAEIAESAEKDGVKILLLPSLSLRSQRSPRLKTLSAATIKFVLYSFTFPQP